MNQQNAVASVAKSGTKLTKNRLLEDVRKAGDREFYFVKDPKSKYAIVRIPLS